tara:strand:+ start:2570 stop:2722 length:153 start_codon:yes stop_codon:yes gene_type:complete
MDMSSKRATAVRMSILYGASPKQLARHYGWRLVRVVCNDMSEDWVLGYLL